MIIFQKENHLYLSVDEPAIDWTSTTSCLKRYKNPFDGKAISERSSKNAKSKWFGIPPKEIQQIWKNEADRAIELGNFYHDRQEANMLACETISRWGKDLPVIWPMYNDKGDKIAPSQRMIEGIYPEHLVYMKSAGLIGQSDLVEIADGYVHISDYKTNKEIEKTSYVNWEGQSKKMLGILSHLDDCNFNHYSLQLSLYMYMVLRHNPRLKPGKITIHHIEFEKVGEDKYGYPIHARDNEGNPIVEQVHFHPCEYMLSEVRGIVDEFTQETKQKQALIAA